MPSSVIKQFAYDPADRRLEIEFVSGRRYAYHAVPEMMVRRMRSALSKGQFFNGKIRDHYSFSRIA